MSDSIHTHLVGTKVSHNGTTGTIISVSRDTIMLAVGRGQIMPIPIPPALRG